MVAFRIYSLNSEEDEMNTHSEREREREQRNMISTIRSRQMFPYNQLHGQI